MIGITRNVAPTQVLPKTYRTRDDAQSAAVAEIGPLARPGFEFSTWKCDGKWHWRALDDVPAPNEAQFKANGGKKFLGTAIASITPQGTIAPTTDALVSRVAILEALVGELILQRVSQSH